MRLENLCIFSLYILLIFTFNNTSFAANLKFDPFTSAYHVQENQQRLSVLASYRKKINELNKKIHKLKRSLSRLIQSQNDGDQSGFNVSSNSKTLRTLDRRQDNITNNSKGNNNISSITGNDELEKKLSDVVISILDEQTKFANLLLKRITIFWNPNFNFGVDISSKGAIERGFLDMLGLGNKQIWNGSSYGGKLLGATDSESRVQQQSILKLIDLSELYRFSMIYNYLHIIGSIYRHTKNFERTVRSRLRLFRNVRERLISTRDSLALLLNADLPDDVELPYPTSPPSYLNMGENCNDDLYNQMLKEITFFKEVQDENRDLSTRIRSGTCEQHEMTGCTFCEIKKVRISLIDWAYNDIQMDLLRLEKDLKLCLDSIQQSKGGDVSGSASMLNKFTLSDNLNEIEKYQVESEDDEQGHSQEEVGQKLDACNSRLEDGEESTNVLTRRRSSGDGLEFKRYKRRSFQHKTSKRISKRRGVKSRRMNMSGRSSLGKDLDTPISEDDKNEENTSTRSFQTHKAQATGSKYNSHSSLTLVNSDESSNSIPSTSPSNVKEDDSIKSGAVSKQSCKVPSDIDQSNTSSPFTSFSDSANLSDIESESEANSGTPINIDARTDTTTESHNYDTPNVSGAFETRKSSSLTSNEPSRPFLTENIHTYSQSQLNKRRKRTKRR